MFTIICNEKNSYNHEQIIMYHDCMCMWILILQMLIPHTIDVFINEFGSILASA